MFKDRPSPFSAVCAGFAASVAVATALSASLQDPGVSQDVRTDPIPFTHRAHVPSAWMLGAGVERNRDCRGCHDYTPGIAHDPQAVCAECHFEDGTNHYKFDLDASDPQLRSNLESLRTPSSLFAHAVHLALECRECHKAQDNDQVHAPELMPRTTGTQLCSQCHNPDRTRDPQFMQAIIDPRNPAVTLEITDEYKSAALARMESALTTRLNATESMGPNADGIQHVRPFRHADHIRAEDLSQVLTLQALVAGTSSCTVCHASMFGAPAGFMSQAGDAAHPLFDRDQASCQVCHIADAQRNPVVFKIEDVPEPSLVAGTFSHASHLGVLQDPPAGTRSSTADGLARIRQEGCFACHQYDGTGQQTYTLRTGMDSFDGCQTCHATAAPWSPPEPLSTATWWTPRDHGGGNWEACEACHDFAQPDFLTNRPVASVRRRAAGLFRIVDQMHPHITVEPGQATAESCKECHRRPVAALPSRIQEAAFRHATHLSADPQPEECANCHGSRVNGATSSDAIAAARLSSSGTLIDLRASAVDAAEREQYLGLTYDPDACNQCHLGSEPLRSDRDTGQAPGEVLAVAEFPHSLHLAEVTDLTCMDCHGVDLQAGGPVETLPSARDCSSCHDHTEHAAQTGSGISAGEVAACARCHVHDVPSVGQPPQVPNTRITDIANGSRQYHPPISETSCGTCHVGWGSQSVATASRGRVRARRTFYAGSQRPVIHRGNTRKTERARCTQCHWTAAFADAGGAAGGYPDPNAPDIRKLLGDDMSDFPGGQ